ncbi:MAG: trypsin-like serine protease, partial [Myxococcales bacterium]|nr:trypsin-like serine protease [Myxococcales bacterium]
MRRSAALAILVLALGACQQQGLDPASGGGAPVGVAELPIVNGQTETGYPGVCAFVSVLPFWGYQGAFCTGTLIAPQWVLTAGHCLSTQSNEGVAPSNTRFMIGNDARPNNAGNPTNGTLYAVDAFYVHPQYSASQLTNDIAIAHLSQAVPNAQTFQPNSTYLNQTGQTGFYVGFGAVEGVNSSGSGLKRSTSFPITWIYNDSYISDFTTTGTCFGDSGGPGFLSIGGSQKIIGITSAGAGCNPNTDPSCDPDPCRRPTIHTRVDHYATWIAQVTNSTPPSCTTNASICACAQACQANGTCNDAVCRTNDCEGAYDCLVSCGSNEGCQSNCYSQATPTAQSQIDALFQCSDSHCANASGDAYATCMGNQCGSQIAACFPVGTGPLSCRDAYGCMYDCADNDSACQNDCYEQGTAVAQGQLDAMFSCFDAQCANASDFSACANQNCAPQIDTCFPTVTGPESCETVAGCLFDCPDNDSACGNACYESGTAQAQAQYDAIVDCVIANCDNLTGSAYSQCVDDHCAAQYNACFPPANCPIVGGGCPSGEACYPTGANQTDCFPSNNKVLGAACADTNTTLDCGDGAICVDGTCQRFCASDASCGAGASCDIPLDPSTPNIGVCGCADADNDGSCADVDCNDGASAVHPGAAEACGNNVDDDCNNQTDEGCASCVDDDHDGYCQPADCNDGDAAIHPSATEKCGDNVDNDCNSQTDEGCNGCVDGDNDGYCAQVDCRDGDPASHPGAAEICGDGIDQNCSGAADEG